MQLNDLQDNPGARKNRTRVGRGIGSGKGKTAGRGVKGQKSRSGVSINGFEGGQMPIYRRLPKRGFKPLSRTEYEIVNLADLERSIEQGHIAKKATVTAKELCAAGLIRNEESAVKLLARGELSSALTLHVAKASSAAAEKVKKAGGEIVLPAPAA